MRMMRKKTIMLLAAAAALLVVPAFAQAQAGGSVSIAKSRFWQSEADPTKGRAVMTIVNKGGNDELVGFSSPKAKASYLLTGAMKTGKKDGAPALLMQPVKKLALEAGKSLDMMHENMFFAFTVDPAALKGAKSFPFELVFSKAGKIAVDIPIGQKELLSGQQEMKKWRGKGGRQVKPLKPLSSEQLEKLRDQQKQSPAAAEGGNP